MNLYEKKFNNLYKYYGIIFKKENLVKPFLHQKFSLNWLLNISYLRMYIFNISIYFSSSFKYSNFNNKVGLKY